MMKKFLLVALIMVSLALAGCNGGGTENFNNARTFVGGTDGVVMSFEESAPPAEVIKGEGFDVVVILTNKGEYTVPTNDYSVKLKGFSPADFDTTSTELAVTGDELPAADINPDTGETIDPYDVYITIPENGGLNYVGGVSGNMEYPMTVELCYPYRTDAYGNLCVKENLQDSTDTDVCTISGAKDITSSGAPVQIRNLEEYSGGSDKIRFSFEIFVANTGGQVSKTLQGCADGYNNEDYVYINIDTGLSGILSCNGLNEGNGRADNSVKLNSGVRKITCSQEISNDERGDYIKTVAIYATYDFKQSMNTKVLIKNVE